MVYSKLLWENEKQSFMFHLHTKHLDFFTHILLSKIFTKLFPLLKKFQFVFVTIVCFKKKLTLNWFGRNISQKLHQSFELVKRSNIILILKLGALLGKLNIYNPVVIWSWRIFSCSYLIKVKRFCLSDCHPSFSHFTTWYNESTSQYNVEISITTTSKHSSFYPEPFLHLKYNFQIDKKNW